MNKKCKSWLTCSLLAVMIIPGGASGSEGAAALDQLSRGLPGLEFNIPAAYVETRWDLPASPGYWRPCTPPVVHTDASGDLYADGRLLRRAESYKTGCTADVAWIDVYGAVYRNADKLGTSARSYEISRWTGDIVWTDVFERIYKNSGQLGTSAVDYSISDVTGDVAWTDVYAHIYKNGARLGTRAVDYRFAGESGEVIWLDSGGRLYRDQIKIGDNVSALP